MAPEKAAFRPHPGARMVDNLLITLLLYRSQGKQNTGPKLDSKTRPPDPKSQEHLAWLETIIAAN